MAPLYNRQVVPLVDSYESYQGSVTQSLYKGATATHILPDLLFDHIELSRELDNCILAFNGESMVLLLRNGGLSSKFLHQEKLINKYSEFFITANQSVQSQGTGITYSTFMIA